MDVKSLACLREQVQKSLATNVLRFSKIFSRIEPFLSPSSIGAGVQWATLNKPATVDDTFTLLQVMLMLLIDAFIYGLVTWYVEAVYPGEYGLPQPWRFPFTVRGMF